MKQIFALILAVVMIFAAGNVFADEMSGSGNWSIDAFAIGGGADASLRFDGTVPGVTGGLAIAGGVGAGEGSGFIKTVNVPTWVPEYTTVYNVYEKEVNGRGNGKYGAERGYDRNIFNSNPPNENSGWHLIGTVTYQSGKHLEWRPLALGTSEGYVGITAGGLANTYAIPGGTFSQAIGEAGIWGGVKVLGLAGGEVCAGAIAGEATVDFSTGFKYGGFTSGLAGQYAVGGLVGGAGAFGIGSGDFEGDIFMYGDSYSQSWSNLTESGSFVVKSLGTNVGASTEVVSFAAAQDCGIGFAFIDGGYTAAGKAETCTVQFAPSGFAKASAVGTYEGCGPVGTNFYGSANGYSTTSVATIPGWSGSINSAASGMSVQIGTTSPAK
jgi:hypothetical protein